MFTSHPIARGLALAGLLSISTCRQAAPVEKPATTSRPAEAVTTSTATTQPAPAPPSTAAAPVSLPLDPHHGWLRIDQLYDGVDGGWVTGDVNKSRNRIIIETNDIRRFSIDVSTLPIRWDRLVVLSINDQTMELTRKRRPLVSFQQTPTGGWDVVSE